MGMFLFSCLLNRTGWMLRSTEHLLILFCRWPAMGIHGDKSQQERDWVLNGTALILTMACHWFWVCNIKWSKVLRFVCFFFSPEFKFGKAPILIATDVASRGLGTCICICIYFFYYSRLLRDVLCRILNCCPSLWVIPHLKVQSWRQDLGMMCPEFPEGSGAPFAGVLSFLPANQIVYRGVGSSHAPGVLARHWGGTTVD